MTFERRLLAFGGLRRRQQKHFDSVIRLAYGYIEAFAQAVKGSEDIMYDMQDVSGIKSDQTRRVYNVVHDEKIRTELSHGSLLASADGELAAASNDPWPDALSEQQRECLAEIMQPMVSSPGDVIGLLRGGVLATPLVWRLCDDLVKCVSQMATTDGGSCQSLERALWSALRRRFKEQGPLGSGETLS